MLQKKKALKWLGIFIAAELALVILITFLFDPFYQYHTPWFGIKEVLNDRDNQVIGTIRNNDYDSVLLGSSVAENFDSDYLDEQTGSRTVKIIRASGSIADLLYYMEKAHARQDIKQVFWCMDIFALEASTEVTLYSADTPGYLHTDTMLDDAVYLLNKEILLEKIPQMLAFSMQGTNTGGQAYNWAEGKDFSAAKAMQAYDKPETAAASQKDLPDGFEQTLLENIALVENEIASHADTKYIIVFPPYSMLWWDCGYVNGMVEKYFAVLDRVMPALLSHENVMVYYFQADRDVICNLDNYMDMIHYAPDINQYMLECVLEDTHRVTFENMEATLCGMRETCEYIIQEGIYLYYPNAE